MIDIKGFEGKYAITEDGKVWNYSTSNFLSLRGSGKRSGKKRGYKTVALWSRDKKYTYFYVHRLVAIHFIPNLKKLKTVNHKDGNKENNTIENLEWCTHKDNVNHAFLNGFTTRGEKNTSTKLTRDQVREIREKYKNDGISQMQLAKIYKVTQTNIGAIVNKRTWGLLI